MNFNPQHATHTAHPLQEQIAALQKHNTTLKETVNTLSKNCLETEQKLQKNLAAHEEKLKLHAQLHSDQVKTLQVKDKTLTERCQTLAAFAEQHRLANLKHEQKTKSLAQDLQNMTAVQVQGERRHATEVKRLETTIKTMDKDVQSLQSNIQTLKLQHSNQAAELGKKLESVSGRLKQAAVLLKASPYSDSDHRQDVDNVLTSLKSSAEVLQLAHSSGGIDSMRKCLGQVGSVLHDLHGQLQGRHRLASEWQKRVEDLIV